MFIEKLEVVAFTSFYLVRIVPSEVRALPLAAGRNEGGHYFMYFSSSCYLVVTSAFQNLKRVPKFCS
jgi:hypothetical protein